jgi:hypothetical protein
MIDDVIAISDVMTVDGTSVVAGARVVKGEERNSMLKCRTMATMLRANPNMAMKKQKTTAGFLRRCGWGPPSETQPRRGTQARPKDAEMTPGTVNRYTGVPSVCNDKMWLVNRSSTCFI